MGSKHPGMRPPTARQLAVAAAMQWHGGHLMDVFADRLSVSLEPFPNGDPGTLGLA